MSVYNPLRTSRHEVVRVALEGGANLFGGAERALGGALRKHGRDGAIVATKVWTSNDRGAERQIERSLDYFSGRVELYQGHRVSSEQREVSNLLLGQICYLVGVDIDRRPTRTRLVRAVSADGALG